MSFCGKHPRKLLFSAQRIYSLENLVLYLPILMQKKDVFLEVDASQHGLGASLLQDGMPVAYGSKSLTPTEQQYALIKKEMYAIAYGCECFHQFLYGGPVTVYSDYKPTESTMQKPLCAAPARVQRMMLKLQKPDVTVVHHPGKDIPLADTLSRKFLENNDSSIGDCPDVMVHTVVTNLPISDVQLRESYGMP